MSYVHAVVAFFDTYQFHTGFVSSEWTPPLTFFLVVLSTYILVHFGVECRGEIKNKICLPSTLLLRTAPIFFFQKVI